MGAVTQSSLHSEYAMLLILLFYSFSVFVNGYNAQLTSNSNHRPNHHFLFTKAKSKVLPNPSDYFSSQLLSTPLPTNSFFQNFVLKNGDTPEYIQPYLIRSANSSVSLCYPSQNITSALIEQIFRPDLTISGFKNPNPTQHHIISSYSDLSVTLDLPSSNLRFFLVRGSPYLTFAVSGNTSISISTVDPIRKLSCDSSFTKYTIRLRNRQTWILYASSPIHLTHNVSSIISGGFSGVIRIALLTISDRQCEKILDQYSSAYPVSGSATLRSFGLSYKWDVNGKGKLLMLAHPLHRRLLSTADSSVTVLDDFQYRSIDGELVGVVGDSWELETNSIPISWHSVKGLNKKSVPEIIRALGKDVKTLNASNISTTSSYFYGKLVARAARLALIAEEVSYPKITLAVVQYLKDTIEPWLNGTFGANGFLYDRKWGGLVTKQGINDTTADFGFGIYNDHHFHLGYFVYGISVLTKFDPAWGNQYKKQAYALVEDYTNLGLKQNRHYTRVRCFDFWKLHSWAAGLNEFPFGRNQESTSEAINAYYSAALMGFAYGDTDLVSIGSTLTAFEMLSAQTWWHVKGDNKIYAPSFVKKNKVVGILWSRKRDSILWFAPAERKDIRLGIQVLPLLPITEVVFSDVDYVKELVKWALTSVPKNRTEEGWKGFVYALEAIYRMKQALKKVRDLSNHDDGNSLSNLLWWIHSRK
ncbi:glucan endo-1,3-beta-D-glucosidase-like [Nicotiana tabacum]|uniref:glucan endo-1,3-beta-D-glucosidase n=1 Tax=Nicotiana tabacum TaxID=4097 RepID=A0A1S3YM95_TOBAC|nr:probable endo-1,3(4)-beta-glucanase ARB_01444 [Nicotiana tomentosiformis]XP_016453050.1 PREDICTED: probable endo-1,3(4)-beta-glucanase ARB_01444 [Nicotiana tabacum]